MWLGVQDQGLLSVAEAHCLRALEYGTAAPAKDRAKALLREIRCAGITCSSHSAACCGRVRDSNGGVRVLALP